MAAGKGGGSWKVAYADFVTAMMAFFLVMWIGAQDQKVRQSVANYFVDPAGVAKKPVQPGAVLDSMTYGSVPKNEAMAMGRGRHTPTAPGEPSPATKMVNDWIHADEKRSKYWREQAQVCREAAARAPEVVKKTSTAQEVAVRSLSNQLQTEIKGGVPTQVTGVYQDLLYGSFADVNWHQLAEDLLAA